MSNRFFQFSEHFGDARLEEFKILSAAEQNGKSGLPLKSVPIGAWRDLLISLVSQGLLTNFSYSSAKHCSSSVANPDPDMSRSSGISGESQLERAVIQARVRAIRALYEDLGTLLELTHLGRVRLSELRQALRAGREREPFGILWDARHWEQDLQIAILDARDDSPLSLGFLDMNGLKQVNDRYGHESGDLALKTYFQAVAAAIGDRGQAYRVGGDEVLVVLPNRDANAAVQVIRRACTRLMAERLESTETGSLLSIAAGVISTRDPNVPPANLRSAADKLQYSAKAQSRQSTPRPSVIAVEDCEELIVIGHDSQEVQDTA